MSVMLTKPEPVSDKPVERKEAVVIKKYANRRLYNTETSTYVTLDDLAAMVRSDRDFVVFDAKTGDDLTQAVLTQIIVEQEAKSGGQTLLSVPFLRQLIRFYDDSIGKMVPSYLQMSMESLVKEQEKFRSQLGPLFAQNPFGTVALDVMQAQTRKNMAMFERAMTQTMTMWTPFGGFGGGGGSFGMDGLPGQAGGQAGADKAGAGDKAGKPAAGAPHVPAATTGPVLSVVPTAQSAVQSAVQSGGATDTDLADLKAELAAMQQKIEKLSSRK